MSTESVQDLDQIEDYADERWHIDPNVVRLEDKDVVIFGSIYTSSEIALFHLALRDFCFAANNN